MRMETAQVVIRGKTGWSLRFKRLICGGRPAARQGKGVSVRSAQDSEREETRAQGEGGAEEDGGWVSRTLAGRVARPVGWCYRSLHACAEGIRAPAEGGPGRGLDPGLTEPFNGICIRTSTLKSNMDAFANPSTPEEQRRLLGKWSGLSKRVRYTKKEYRHHRQFNRATMLMKKWQKDGER